MGYAEDVPPVDGGGGSGGGKAAEQQEGGGEAGPWDHPAGEGREAGHPLYCTAMRAAVIEEDGNDGDRLRVREVAEPPAPAPGAVLLRVRAAGINPADWQRAR